MSTSHTAAPAAPAPTFKKVGVALAAAALAVVLLSTLLGGIAGTVYSVLGIALAGGAYFVARELATQLAAVEAATWMKVAAWAAFAIGAIVVVATLWWLLLPLVGLGAAASKAARV